MPSGQVDTLVQFLRRIAGTSGDETSDARLLERFVRARDEVAFATLVKRHGPMVLRVCRSLLRDVPDAEDAFQATFLVLVRRAGAVGRPELLGHWLCGVAYRVALKARDARARRQRRETQGVPADSVGVEPVTSDVGPPLFEELQRLPVRLRMPVVLYYLEGKTKRQAAQRLGWPEGTVATRLARARELLRGRLTRRGLAFSGAGFAAVMGEATAPTAVPAALVQSTVQAGLWLAAGTPAAAALASARAIGLSEAVLGATVGTKLKALAILLLGLTLAGTGAWAVAYQRQEPAADGAKAPAANPPAVAVRQSSSAAEVPPDKMLFTGSVKDENGKLVAGATVMVLANPRRSFVAFLPPVILGRTTTAADGRFRLVTARLSAQEHSFAWILANATGHALGWQNLLNFDESHANDKECTVSLRLAPEQEFHARLVDLQGRPAAGVRIYVWNLGRHEKDEYRGMYLDTPEGVPEDISVWPAPRQTDNDGRFTVRGLAADQYLSLTIRDDRYAAEVWDIDSATKSLAREATHALAPARVLTGRVTYADTHKPVPHARLFVDAYKYVTGRQFTHGSTDGDGRFRIVPHRGDVYSITASPPDGEPYLAREKGFFTWPKNATTHEVNFALPRGILLRGKVIDQSSEKPIAGARLGYWLKQTESAKVPDIGSDGQGRLRITSDRDGRFHLAVLPTAGWLLIKAPTADYLHVETTAGELAGYKPSNRKYYPDGLVALHPQPGTTPPEITVKLRRGLTVRGRIHKPDGTLAPGCKVICPGYVPDDFDYNYKKVDQLARDGRFEVPGCDPTKSRRLLFFDVQSEIGAIVDLSGKQANEDIDVRLLPCGAARARLVDVEKKPFAKHGPRTNPHLQLLVVVSPGSSTYRPEDLQADVVFWSTLDRRHEDLCSDADGRIRFPALVPGAVYRILLWQGGNGPAVGREFTVEAGKTLDLGDIVMKRDR